MKSNLSEKIRFVFMTIICLSLLAVSARATTYYVDSVAGLDTNSGTTHQYSMENSDQGKLDHLFARGDSVLFNRGCSLDRKPASS